LHGYNDTNGSLPAGYMMAPQYGWNDENNFGPPWSVMVLPHLEQEPLYKTVSASVTLYKNYAMKQPFGTIGSADQGWRVISKIPLNVVRRPSEEFWDLNGQRVGRDWARGNYAANAGPCVPGDSMRGASPQCGFGRRGGGVMCANYGISVGRL